MCRIMGVSLANHDEKLDLGEIAAILFPELVRQGPHAYGWMTWNPNDSEIKHEKFVGRSDTDKAWNNIIYGVDPKAQWLVGHTRYATHGDPADLRNDHPIPHGKIIGVHNGVLSNHEEILSVTGREDPKTKVDSEAIFAAVNKWGPTKGLRRVRGDMVAVYANRTKPNVVHIARTHGRQLTLGFTVKGNIIFASDQAALHKLEPDIKFDHFTTISENRLLLVRDGKIIQRYTFREPTHRKVYTPPPARVVVPSVRAAEVRGKEVREVIASQGDATLLAAYDRLQTRRAVRRGEMLFPNGQPTKKVVVSRGKSKKPKGKAKGRRSGAPNQNEKPKAHDPELSTRPTRYYNGQLMTEREYREMIGSEDNGSW